MMACTKVQKVQFDTHMILEEAEDKWENVRQKLKVVGIEIIWVVLRVKFFRSIFQRTCTVKRRSSSSS